MIKTSDLETITTTERTSVCLREVEPHDLKEAAGSETKNALLQLLKLDKYPEEFKIKIGKAIIILHDALEVENLIRTLIDKLSRNGYTVRTSIDPTIDSYEFYFSRI